MPADSYSLKCWVLLSLIFWRYLCTEVSYLTAEHLGLTSEDVGSRIRLVFTPVRKDGEEGETLAVVSDIVVDGMCGVPGLECQTVAFLESHDCQMLAHPPEILHCVILLG
jgi:hypothetical protein